MACEPIMVYIMEGCKTVVGILRSNFGGAVMG